eukprot:TRINITY_DN75863_c0_g1_i1.p1 TRINITY_DN75863_c0_g1~~TRINITY_DN75863_c0_g1_i1.p1  ORF type:complete len:665 (+),score=80.56 TRINITY_DN75863_c0_g1_i1:212-1996(+)
MGEWAPTDGHYEVMKLLISARAKVDKDWLEYVEWMVRINDVDTAMMLVDAEAVGIADEKTRLLDLIGHAMGSKKAAMVVALVKRLVRGPGSEKLGIDVVLRRSVTLFMAEQISSGGGLGSELLEAGLVTRSLNKFEVKHPWMDKVEQAWMDSRGLRVAAGRADSFYLTCEQELLLPQRKPWWTHATYTDASVAMLLYETPWCREVVQALASCPRISTMTTVGAQSIIEYAWEGVKVIYFVDCILSFVYVVLLCRVAWMIRAGGDLEGVVIFLLFSLSAKSSVEELVQAIEIVRRRSGIHPRSGNLVDWARLVLDCASIRALLTLYVGDGDEERSSSPTPAQRTIIGAWCGVHWLHALNSLRGFYFFGPRVLPIIYAVADTFVFFLVLAFGMCGAVHAYYVLGVREEPTPFVAALLPIFRLAVLGDVDLFEFEGSDTVYVADGGVLEPQDPEPTQMYIAIHVLFVIVTVAISVTLLNLFVGILGANYDKFEDMGMEIFSQERARIIVTCNARPWLRCLPRCIAWPLLELGKDLTVSDNKYLWVGAKVRAGSEETTSQRTWTKNMMRTVAREEFDAIKAEVKKTNELLQNVMFSRA